MLKRLILFILLIPATLAYECITYDDCPVSQCIGSIRACADGNCAYSACLSTDNSTLREDIPDSGYHRIVGLSVKFTFLALGIIVISLIFSVMNIKGKVIAGIAICLVLLGVYIFLRPMHSGDSWNSTESDNRMIQVLNHRHAELAEKIVGQTPMVRGGKEYRIMERLHETSVTILTAEQTIELKPKTTIEAVSGQQVRVSETGLFSTYVWTDHSLQFIVVGEPRSALSVTEDLLVQKPAKVLPPGSPPEIDFMTNAVTSKNNLVFSIHDNDSELNMSSLSVSGIDKPECTVGNCSATGLHQGNNHIDISVSDIEGHTTRKSSDIILDTTPWEFLPVYPTETYVNKPRIDFIITDNIGLADNFEIIGVPLNTGTCEKTPTQMHCRFDNLELAEGAYSIGITGTDLAGNENSAKLEFVYDHTRPEIEITGWGFIIRENIQLRNESLIVDRKRYSLSDCIYQDREYLCQLSPYKSISIADSAGNIQNVEIQFKR